MIINSRPAASAAVPTIPSLYQHGDIVGFQPGVLSSTVPQLVQAMIMRISFDLGKVLYDLALSDGAGGFYTEYPVCTVDSYFVTDWP